MDSFLSIQRFESLSQLADGSTTQLEDTLQMLEELKDLKTLKEYEPIVQSYCQMRMQRKYLKDALAKTQEETKKNKSKDADEVFKRHMADLMEKGKEDPYDCPIMRSYKEKLANLTSELNPSDVVATSSSNNYVDPITKTTIVNPVRNTICKHVYDKNSINEMMKTNDRTKCPVVGCGNRQIIQEDMLVDDEDVALKLSAMKIN